MIVEIYSITEEAHLQPLPFRFGGSDVVTLACRTHQLPTWDGQ